MSVQNKKHGVKTILSFFLKKLFFHIMKKTLHRIYHNARNITGTEEDIFSEKCVILCKFVDY